MVAINGSGRYAESAPQCPPLMKMPKACLYIRVLYLSTAVQVLRLVIFDEVSFSRQKGSTMSN
jgi:hypothetical protein